MHNQMGLQIATYVEYNIGCKHTVVLGGNSNIKYNIGLQNIFLGGSQVYVEESRWEVFYKCNHCPLHWFFSAL